MSNPNAQIYGSANFYDQSENGGLVTNAIFQDNAINSGVVSVSAFFADAATNDGIIQSTATFTGISTNNGIVEKVAIFTDSAVNSETAVIQGDANFSSGTVNNGVLQGTNSGTGGVIDHPYHYGSYWANESTLELGNTVYLYRYENVKASNVTISSPGLTAEVNSQGIVTSITRIDHPNRHSIYWSDDVVLSIGSSLYVSQYTNTLAGSSNFNAAGYIVTFVNGLVTQIQAAGLPNWYEDTSSAAHAVTLNGTVVQSDEGGGVKAASFDGSGYITSPSNTDYDLTGDFTVELFAKLSSTGQNTFVSDGIGVTGWQIRQIEDGTHNLMFYRYDGGTEEYYAFGYVIPADSTWHHIVAARQGTTLKLFVNGVMTASHETSTQFTRINDSTPLVLGRGEYYSADNFINLQGSIANLRIVTGTALYTSNFVPPTTLPTAVTGTQLLMNFGATNAPITDINDIFTDASIYGTYNGYYNVTPCSYTTHGGLFYVDGVPYTGTHAWTEFAIQYDGYGQTGYTPTAREMRFVDGVAVGDPSLGYVSWYGYPQYAAGATLHGNLWTDLPTLAIGTKVYTFDGTNYNQDFSSYYLGVGATQYQYSGGIISSSGPA